MQLYDRPYRLYDIYAIAIIATGSMQAARYIVKDRPKRQQESIREAVRAITTRCRKI